MPARLLTHAGCVALACVVARSSVASQATVRHLSVLIDRSDPSGRQAELTIDLGAPFDPKKPTVLVVEDGQQYYVRPGAMAALQHDLFGPDVNVAGLVPRGSDSVFVAATLRRDGSVDWLKAWRVFNSDEWIADLDAARRALVGDSGRVDVYGRSGGAYLVHQFLSVHAANVRRAFTQSAVEPSLNRELRIPLDDYVEQLAHTDSALLAVLRRALPPSGEARLRALVALQRQHFYVPADSFVSTQRMLIEALARHDTASLRRFEERYEVPGIMRLESSHDVIPQNVRVLELIYPSGAFGDTAVAGIYPLVESQAAFIRPLLDLVAGGKIAVRARDQRTAHRARTQVFVLASRGDEAVDYRTSIALANQYPVHELFVANDNHTFDEMDRVGARALLVRRFFTDGPGSSGFIAALAAAEPLRWRGGAAIGSWNQTKEEIIRTTTGIDGAKSTDDP